jgi:hypothetical protein
MSWDDAHRYRAALRAAEADLDRCETGVVEWRPEYAEVFGTPQRLLLALRSYWVTMVQAQIEWRPEGHLRRMETARKLAAEHPGLVRALTRSDDVELVGAA